MRRRFTLGQLMLAIAAVGLEFGLLPTTVAIVAACMTLTLPLVTLPRTWAALGFRAIVVVTALVILAGLALPVLVPARGDRRSDHCASNLRQIALALCQYRDAYGSFPPAYVADPKGTPLYSWRVLVLPFLDGNHLYNDFNLSEPWDSPANAKASNTRIRIFSCPESNGSPYWSNTNYLAITGPGTAFPGVGTIAESDLRDGPSATIVLAEVANAKVHWAEPVDLDIATMSLRVNDSSRPGISTVGKSGPAVAFADGHVQRLGDSLSPATLRALLTIGGGEKIGMGQLDR